MAEFQEVARHWKRMCKKYWTATSCHGCPIAEHERGYEACSVYESDVVKMEELVMSWAAEHPEPVYPIWFEWLEKIGVAGRAYDLEPYFTGDKEILQRTAAFTAKAFEPIPTFLAEKLGIEPKEV